MSENIPSSTPSQRTIAELLEDFARVDAKAKALQKQLADIERQLAERGIPRRMDGSGKDTVEM